MARVKIISVLLMLLLLCACATNNTDDPAEDFKDYSAQQLYQLGSTAVADGNYRNAIRYFEALDSLYPFGPYSEPAQRDIIYAYFQKGDYDSAEAAADRYIHLYPRSAHVDYAYYMKGVATLHEGHTFLQRLLPIDLAKRDLSTAESAFFDFRDLVQLFPDSRYAPDARAHMIMLRNTFARHELEVGEFYYDRYAYVAAANRASFVIHHYQGTPQVKDALVLLIKSNRKMGLNQQADDAYKVLAANYPHSRETRRLQPT